MKKFLFRALFFLLPFLYSIYASSQPKKESDCSATCFSSEVVSAQKISDTCTAYELKVSYSGACAHALSHFAVAVPCGTIESLWNSGLWAQEIGTDPTSGLTGLKIDNISGFGQSSLESFTVKFTVCTPDEACASLMRCWQPLVAYKASTCVNYETLSVSCNVLKASLEKQDVSCFNANDGSLSVVIEDGQEPYSFAWSDNSTGQSLTGLTPGNYSVVVRDQSGAELTLEETIEQPEEILLSGTAVPASCNGVADGAIDLAVSGGEGQYSFLWNTGAVTEDVENLIAGLYTVTVKDAASCSASTSFTIGSKTNIEITGIVERADCNGSNGSIDIQVIGGAIPYTFEWTSLAITEDLEGIASGSYSVTVKDFNGCTQSQSFTVDPDNTLALKAEVTPAGCNNEPTGGIDLTVTGGTSPYQYKWSRDGVTVEDLQNVPSGHYAVKVTDSKGCTINGGYAVPVNTFQVPRIVTQPTCQDENDGAIKLQEPNGGTAPFTYDWEGSDESGTELTGLLPGVYAVTVTDAAGCSQTVRSTINNPSGIFASAAVSSNDCTGAGPFSIDLTVTGGTSPYVFTWDDGITTEDRSGLEPGTYTVLITDDHGCSTSKEILVEGGTSSFVCMINEPSGTPACGSENNILSTSITDADAYAWQVESTDGNWSLAGAHTPEIMYTAGGENSSATFTLTIEKDGCTQTCTYTISSCTPADGGTVEDPGEEEPGGDNPGGEDPGGQEPGGEDPGEDDNGDGGSQTCETCFGSIVKLLEVSGECRTYEVEVNTNGLCRHDLSHWTLAIPCGTLSNAWNSEGWKMEYGNDPTTGLYGLKVDDINGFGKEAASFIVRFTLCEGAGCALTAWSPTVAYKAGQCVGVEAVSADQSAATASLSVYPNPFNETVNFAWSGAREHVTIQIIDQYGNTLSTVSSPSDQTGSNAITLESSALPKGMYYYRLTIAGRSYSGKISKR